MRDASTPKLKLTAKKYSCLVIYNFNFLIFYSDVGI